MQHSQTQHVAWRLVTIPAWTSVAATDPDMDARRTFATEAADALELAKGRIC